MLRNILSICLFCLTTLAFAAPDAPVDEEMGKRLIALIKSRITITDAQEQNIKTMASAVSLDGLSGEDLKEEVRKFKRRVTNEVLTEEQRTAYKQAREG